MKLTVFLGKNASESFDIQLIDNSFTNKWIDELSWCLENCEFDYNEILVYFLSIDDRKNKLIESINNINSFFQKSFKRNFINLPDNIDWSDQDFYNDLHMSFEKLSGTYDNPTKIFLLSSENIKQSIRNLNFYIHSLEGVLKNITDDNNEFKISFDKTTYRRHYLDEKDYELFSFEYEKGGLYLSYCELGKTLYEVWLENLPLNYNGLKNLHYYSGECFLYFADSVSMDKNFIELIQTLNDDNKTKGLGFIKLGQISDVETVKNLLQKHQHLHSIKIERE